MHITKETIVPILKVPSVAPGNPTVPTVHRWLRQGVRGVRLESFLIGGRRYTSHEAIERFILASSAAGAYAPPLAAEDESRSRAVADAEVACEAAGI